MAASNVLVLDNGAYTAKVGQSTSGKIRVIPNSIFKAKSERRRAFIGDQLEECKDYSGLFYVLPFSKGYLVNWDIEKQIWDHLFGKDGLQLKFEETTLLITEAQFNLPSIKEAMDEILFEEYNFHSISRSTAPQLSSYKSHQEEAEKHLATLVIDSGYSFTHVVPVFNGKIIKKAVRRINIGGKLLTNHLKEIISYRQLHVLDETHVINQLKEDTCFVSNQFYEDVDVCRLKGPDNTIVRDYVLPDYSHIKRGYVKPVDEMWDSSSKKENEQILRMNIERFSVPELLFRPSDIGIQEMGIAEAVICSVESLPKEMQPHFYSNILLTGGCTMFRGFKERLFNDVRSLAPVDYDIAVYQPVNPLTYGTEGGLMLSQTETFIKKMCVTKAEYEEHGKNICKERFD